MNKSPIFANDIGRFVEQTTYNNNLKNLLKMKKFYLFSLMLGIVFGSLAFTSCSSDDSKDNPTTGGSLVGKWKANISAKET